MNDAEGVMHHMTPKSVGAKKWFRRTAGLLALATVLPSAVIVATRPAGADQLSNDKAQAAQIASQINILQGKLAVLGQSYDEAQYHLSQINGQIAATKSAIAAAKAQVTADTSNLRSSAIDAYIDAGTEQTSNPLFATDQKTYAARSEYNNVAGSQLASDVASLTVAQDSLNAQQAQLQTQQSAAQAQTAAAASAVSQASALQSQLNGQLSQVKGQIATLVAQQQAAAAAEAAAAEARSGGSGGVSGAGQNIPNPPSNEGLGQRALAYAASQVGVPYVWGDATPGQGFDCSGLVMWAYGMAGVSLPRFSGAQWAASTPISENDLEPGDLIFFGYGSPGNEHVAIYAGGGSVLQAPETGQNVGYTSLGAMIAWGSSGGAIITFGRIG